MIAADALWLPRSTCGPRCLPGAVPRVSSARIAGRVVATVAVLLTGALAVPALPFVPAARRARVLRALARALLAALGVTHAMAGRLPGREAGRGVLLVAHHVSWLDVLVMVARAPARLIAKREVRDYPLIGAMAAAAGTVFIDRLRPRSLPQTVAEVAVALRGGSTVTVFPEGTTWCGRASGEFRPAMFQAAVDAGAPVAPVTLSFRLADGSGTTVAAFIGDDTLLASMGRVMRTRGLRVVLRAHPALHPAPDASRRRLASAAHAATRSWAPRSLRDPSLAHDLA